jgi:hypothetical protein
LNFAGENCQLPDERSQPPDERSQPPDERSQPPDEHRHPRDGQWRFAFMERRLKLAKNDGLANVKPK